MQATSTVVDAETAPPEPPPPSPRSFGRAVADLRDGAAARELWSHLGWQDIKQRYRRSVLGPFWITISQAVIALGLGLLYGVLFGQNFQTFLPYVLTGLITWTFISNCLIEGMETFIVNEGLIKHLPAPLSVYTLRTVWRQMLMFAHNSIVYVAALLIFFGSLDHEYAMSNADGVCTKSLEVQGGCSPGLSWEWFLGFPGLVLVVVNMSWVAMFFGIISTRFRDFPQLINAIVQLLFYLTPIVWPIQQLTLASGSRHGLADIALPIIKLNPIYHLVQVVRGPFVGQVVSPSSYLAVIVMAIVGWGATLLLMRNYRARVSYWV